MADSYAMAQPYGEGNQEGLPPIEMVYDPMGQGPDAVSDVGALYGALAVNAVTNALDYRALTNNNHAGISSAQNPA